MSEAPSISSKANGRWVYPAPGTRIHKAWQAAWGTLAESGEPLAGPELSRQVASGANVDHRTVRNLLKSAADAGLLIKTVKSVDAGRGPRLTSLFAINPEKRPS